MIYCPNCNEYHEEWILYPMEHTEYGVIFNNNGITNKFNDGTAGITPEIEDLAFDIDNPICPICNTIAEYH